MAVEPSGNFVSTTYTDRMNHVNYIVYRVKVHFLSKITDFPYFSTFLSWLIFFVLVFTFFNTCLSKSLDAI